MAVNEPEYREFIRRLNLLRRDVAETGRQVRAFAQSVGESRSWEGGFVSVPCLTTISGIIASPDGDFFVGSIPIPNSSVQFVGKYTGTDYGTFTTPDGNFSVDLILDPYDIGELNLYVRGPGFRFDPSPPAQTVFVTYYLSNNLGEKSPTAAAGYQWTNDGSGRATAFPVSNTLHYDDSVLGTGTITGTINWSSGCQPGTSFAYGSCASVSGVWSLSLNASLGIFWFSNSLGSCPRATTCATGGISGYVAGGQTNTFVSQVDPDETTLFEVVFDVVEPAFHGPGTHQLRIYEV